MKTLKVTTAAFLAGVTTLAVSLPSFAETSKPATMTELPWIASEMERGAEFSLDAELGADGMPIGRD